MIWLLIPLALLSGMFGRMGGAGKSGQWYEKILDTNWRDIGCAVVLLLAFVIFHGWHPEVWWAYALTGVLTFLSFRSYYDKIFGKDTFWFAGLLVGLAAFPMLFVDRNLCWILLARTVVIMVVWECLNRYLPQRVWIWGRDVVEENARYAVSL